MINNFYCVCIPLVDLRVINRSLSHFISVIILEDLNPKWLVSPKLLLIIIIQNELYKKSNWLFGISNYLQVFLFIDANDLWKLMVQNSWISHISINNQCKSNIEKRRVNTTWMSYSANIDLLCNLERKIYSHRLCM